MLLQFANNHFLELQIVRLLAISILPAASLVFYSRWLMSGAKKPLVYEWKLTKNSALSLTGCSADSPGLTNIFLVSLNSSKEAELRVGYFGK
jgi:hypothetical protein